jgi:hypothetical protein
MKYHTEGKILLLVSQINPIVHNVFFPCSFHLRVAVTAVNVSPDATTFEIQRTSTIKSNFPHSRIPDSYAAKKPIGNPGALVRGPVTF